VVCLNRTKAYPGIEMITSPCHRVVVLPGDGIGPSVVSAACRVLEATGVGFRWKFMDVGWRAYTGTGDALPREVVDAIRERGVALKGPVETRPDSPFSSVNVGIRRALSLRAQVRPVRSLSGAPSRYGAIDLMVVRETTEDLYQGIEFVSGSPPGQELAGWLVQQGYDVPTNSGISIKPISPGGMRTFLDIALAYVERQHRRRVTIVHKAAVMRATDGLFLREAMAACALHRNLVVNSATVDAVAAGLVRHPEEYDVLLTTNQYGDILSDLASGLVGGVGLAAGANLGSGSAVFEAAHGTAPRHAGRNTANPFGLILSGAMMLDHLGEGLAATRVRSAVAQVVRDGVAVTRDLRAVDDPRPTVATDQVAQAVIDRL
jgi:isocitrate dehydrogenase (NAD+)